jgi:AICAR transformylase/IMP cyclohydrolase PurH
MTDLVKVKTALISVSDKTDLLVLAAALKDCGVQVHSRAPFPPRLRYIAPWE